MATWRRPPAIRAATVRGPDAEWLNVLTRLNASRVEYAIGESKVVVAGPAFTEAGEPATGFWVVQIGNDDELNLWSTEPAFVWPGEVAPWWTVTRGQPAPVRPK